MGRSEEVATAKVATQGEMGMDFNFMPMGVDG
jgi:hypothetical protein